MFRSIAYLLCALLLPASSLGLPNTPPNAIECGLRAPLHLRLNSSYSSWWLGVEKGSKLYKVVEPPATVMAVLSNQSTETVLNKPFYGKNLQTILQNKTMAALFDRPWYYTIYFQTPDHSVGCHATLTMKGINYRSDEIELNGKPIVPRNGTGMVGTLRYFDFDISTLRDDKNANVLSVRLQRPHDWPMEPNSTELAMPFLDWNPEPPDGNLGIWRDIELTMFPSVPVSIRFPLVNLLKLPSPENDTCLVECAFELYNSDPAASHKGRVKVELTFFRPIVQEKQREISAVVTLLPQSGKVVALTAASVENCSELLWWPWQMEPRSKQGGFYRAKLHGLSASFHASSLFSTPPVSDTLHAHFGLRKITKVNVLVGEGFHPSPSIPNMTSAALFSVNGRRLMVRGGGFASDLFLRTKNTPIDFKRHVQYVQQLGLNTIRLEGQFVDDALFQYANEYGVLIIPGIVCCDAWQHWDLWGTEQVTVAMDSVRSQVKRLRIHPSSFCFLLSSDELPPEDIERGYENILREEMWPNPTMSSAGSWISPLSGQSGAKMTGPYAWVPPNYWTDPTAKKMYGGASGFIAETSPGASVLTMEAIAITIPEKHEWDHGSTQPNDYWTWHAGSETGKFSTLAWFTPALNARLGNSRSAGEFTCKSQYMAYESHRAMMEAYSMNKYGGGNDAFVSTGVVQWMLNSAWPSNIWHLYDYYGIGGGAFYGTKKATHFPLHLAFDYTSFGVTLINSGYTSFTSETLVATASLHTAMEGKTLVTQTLSLPKVIHSDTSVNVLSALPKSWLGLHEGTVLLRLVLSTTVEHTENPMDVGTYALPGARSTHDVVDFTSCNYFRCNLSSFANMTDLQFIPPARVNIDAYLTGMKTVSVILENPHLDRIAFFVNVASVLFSDGNTVDNLVWSDNYIVLLPQERRTITAQIYSPGWTNSSKLTVKRVRLRVFNNCTTGT